MYQKAPRGEARREAILRATLSVIAAHGTDGVTHRAVAAEAGVPLSATTYWFDSREELLEETLRFAAREETERLERIVLDLAPRELTVRGWAEALSELLISEIEAEPERHMALYELGLEAARRPGAAAGGASACTPRSSAWPSSARAPPARTTRPRTRRSSSPPCSASCSRSWHSRTGVRARRAAPGARAPLRAPRVRR